MVLFSTNTVHKTEKLSTPFIYFNIYTNDNRAIENWCNRFLFRSKAKPVEILREQDLKWAVSLTFFPPSFFFSFDTELLILVMYVL